MVTSDENRTRCRRSVLRKLGAVGVFGIAGCSSDDGTNASDGSTTPTQTGGATATAQPGTPTPGNEDTATPNDDTATPEETATPDEGPSVSELESRVSSVSFEGTYLDTHVHWAGAEDTRHDVLDPGTLATRYGDNEVGAATVFTSSSDVASDYESVLQGLATDDTDYLPFLQPDTYEHLNQGKVTEVYESYPDVFRGIGEIVFYSGPFRGTSLTADPWPDLFAFAEEKDIPLMIHPTQAQEEGLKTMLGRYPNATVMAHGGEFNLSRRKLEPILENNDNLYWTLDAGSMLNGLVLRADDAADFASQYDGMASEFKGLVERTLPWMMNAAPDRVMWGTDLATAWNTDPKVISRVMDWTEAAVDALPADQQAKYTHENATRLFGL